MAARMGSAACAEDGSCGAQTVQGEEITRQSLGVGERGGEAGAGAACQGQSADQQALGRPTRGGAHPAVPDHVHDKPGGRRGTPSLGSCSIAV